MSESLPSQAQVVIIGGGIVGCSVAYHLAQSGFTDVLLLERKSLTSGTTWHAAGLVAQLRGSRTQTELAGYGADLYASLEGETGQATGFRRTGTLQLAQTSERMVELRRRASAAKGFGLEAHLISASDAGKLWPLMHTDDLQGALYVPTDGQTDPVGTTQALAKGARNGGASVLEDVKVERVLARDGTVQGVVTEQGEVACEVIVNCAGMWASSIAGACGVAVRLQAAEHSYVVTEPLDGLSLDLPSVRDPDGYIYFKQDAGKLVLGGVEPVAKPWGVDGIPDDFCYTLLNEDWDQIQIFVDHALIRIPAMKTVGIRQLLVGPESFTPDGRYILGEAPTLRNFFVAAGFNSIGIASAGGAGRALAEWIVHGAPTMDLWDVDIARFQGFQGFQGNRRYLRDRIVESVGLSFAIQWPHRQVESARPIRCSPLHERLATCGACFGECAGWERPNWFATKSVEAKYTYTYARPSWFECVAREHRAVREAVGLFDESSFAKFLLQGHDVERLLQHLCANDVGVPVGRVIYSPMLNPRGGFECDVTVTRLAESSFLIVTGAAAATHDFHWIRRHISKGEHVVLTDVSSAFAVIAVMGPNSRALLQRVTDADMSNSAFPFSSSREIDLAYARVRATRITYVGELGWELYIPTEFAASAYDALVTEGDGLGLVDAGYHALDSLRCERGYRHWGADIGREDSPLEAGLGFAVAFDKGHEFIGREALERQRSSQLRRRLAIFTLEDPRPALHHHEPIFRDEQVVGQVTSGTYGHTLGRAVGLGYVEHPDGVDDAFLSSGRYEIEIAAERRPATLHLAPPYDPRGARVRL